jgi:alanyl-tRNA synthetase
MANRSSPSSIANDVIGSAVRAYQVSRAEADEMGALAFFGDKYGEQVRIVEAGAYSRELCGGTHVPTTGQIGPLIVVGESSIGSNLRRIEALTGSAAYEYLTGLRRQLDTAAVHLRVRPEDVGGAAAGLVARTRAQEERIEAYEEQARSRLAPACGRSREVGRCAWWWQKPQGSTPGAACSARRLGSACGLGAEATVGGPRPSDRI